MTHEPVLVPALEVKVSVNWWRWARGRAGPSPIESGWPLCHPPRRSPIARYGLRTHKPYIIGYPDGESKPYERLTRAQVATIFMRILELEGLATGQSLYADVDSAFWAGGAIWVPPVTHHLGDLGDHWALDLIEGC